MISESVRSDSELIKYEKAANVGEFHNHRALAQSDPIYGSLGPEEHNPEDHTDEVNFEMQMRKYKPLEMKDEMESMDSLAWAEKSTGAKLVMKDKDAPPPARQSQIIANAMAEDFDEDEDVKATRKSIAASIKINDYEDAEKGGRDWFDCIGARNGRCRSDIKREKEDEKNAEHAESINARADINEKLGKGEEEKKDEKPAAEAEKP